MKEPISIGELIVLLKHVEDQTADVCFDFPGHPTFDEVESWRGVYAMPALSYVGFGETKTVADLIEELSKSIDGRTYSGWKGGEFAYTAGDFLHVANAGQSGGTVLVGIKDERYRVVLLTEYQPDNF